MVVHSYSPKRGASGNASSLDPSRLVFLDESAAKTNMTRLRFAFTHGHWRTTATLGAVRLDGTTNLGTAIAFDSPSQFQQR